ncbi:MAG: DNA-3-methyladenine glycosylase [Candidatus Bathyarchaeota archaeon]|nr:DNA-3-methyladenine glycosylase [Candidatus Bathyarchaeota archaeon]
MKIFERKFYEGDPAAVAKALLGKILVRKVYSKILSGKIVETEAYYGEQDPASRAYKGRMKFNELMYAEPGRTFIYMVHGNWLLNIVAHFKGEVGAVLIRAVEPILGIEVMVKNREVENFHSLTNGPGKLSKALAITKDLNGIDVTKRKSELRVTEGKEEEIEISSSHRIGVRVDLPQELRFFIRENKLVSRARRNPRRK